jgi:hypothetical protein
MSQMMQQWMKIFLENTEGSNYDSTQLTQEISWAYLWCMDEIQSWEKSYAFFACTVMAAVGDIKLANRHNLKKSLGDAKFKTIGHYMDALRKIDISYPRGEYEEELEIVMKNAKVCRNYLVHRFLLPSIEMEDVAYIASLSHEIHLIHEYIAYANARISDAAHFVMNEVGMNEKQIWEKMELLNSDVRNFLSDMRRKKPIPKVPRRDRIHRNNLMMAEITGQPFDPNWKSYLDEKRVEREKKG